MDKGVGFTLPPGSVATWIHATGKKLSFPINFAFEYNDQTAGQAGPTGGTSERGPAFLGRYAGGGTVGMSSLGYMPQGWSNELEGLNEVALINWHNKQDEAHKAKWDGKPTRQNIYDLMLTAPKGGAFYNEHLPEGIGKLPEEVDTRPLPAIGDPVEVLKAGAWLPDTVKGFTGQAITFTKAGNRLKADRDKTWRVVGAVPAEPAPPPVTPPKPPVPTPPTATRPKIPVRIINDLYSAQTYFQDKELIGRAAAMARVRDYILTLADRP